VTFLNIRGLKKSFGIKPILRGIDLSMEKGECVALMGANGAGKTTLLRILAGLTRPSAGRVSLDGLDIVGDAQQVRSMVGFVAHQPYLYDELTALENLRFFGKMYAVASIEERAGDLLRAVGLEKWARERVSVLSRGQVQRLAWARALLHSPQLLLLDEPDTGLDQEGQELVTSLIHEHVVRGAGILFTTHQPERALALSDTLLLLKGGRVALRQRTAAVEADTISQTYAEVTTP
jgi:heme ABC exporter ATP-binding subunit CcmA